MALAKGWMKKDAFYGYKMEQDETAPVFLTYDELQTVMNKEFTIPPTGTGTGYFHFRLFHRSGICRCVHAQKKKIWCKIIMETGGSEKEESN